MAKVYKNWNRQTCIAFREDDGMVQAVAMQSPELAILEMGYEQFHSQWELIEGVDAKKAAQQYLTGLIPFNNEVKTILEQIMEVKGKDAAAEKTEAFFGDKETKTTKAKGKGKSGEVAVTKAKPKAKGKATAPAKKAAPAKGKAKAEPKAKAKKEQKPKEDLSTKTINLIPNVVGKRFQEGSVRSQCFALIKDGMTVKAFLAAVSKKQICEEKAAIDCLKKLQDTTQKQPTITLS
jgi:hypothetical protein